MEKIRAYTPEDYPEVAEALKRAKMYKDVWDGEENLAGMIEEDPESVLVATVDGTVVGSIVTTPYGPKAALLFRLVVKEEYRNQGIGSQLLEHAETVLKRKGVTNIGIFVDIDDTDLQNYYAKRGYKQVKNPFVRMNKDL